MKIIKKLTACILAIALICGCFQTVTYLEGTSKVEASNLTPIMGSNGVTIGQMINYYNANATRLGTSYPAYYTKHSSAKNIYQFCKIYYDECKAEGVRVEVAFPQAMKETGFLTFTGRVPISAYNFAGMGATDGTSKYCKYSSVRKGIRAQVQHLKAYASKEALNKKCVDSRFKLVTRGSAKYVEYLGIHENPTGAGWASAINYGYSLRDDYMAPLMSASTYTTWYKGVDYSLVYDPDDYMAHNADVAKLYYANGAKLISHFVNHGMKEGRVAKDSFNVRSYANRYRDLRKLYKNNWTKYYLHYIDCGAAEGRVATGFENKVVAYRTIYKGVDYSAVYDMNYYLAKHPKLLKKYGYDENKVLKYFVKHGMKKGQQASANFNLKTYMANNKDLVSSYGKKRKNYKKYYIHYCKHGLKEGRKAV